MAKRILVTGGMGFIGSNFILHLLNKSPDCRVVNLDALTYAGNPDNLQNVPDRSRYRFIKGDIGDRGLLDRILSEGVEAIVNFAAESHVDRSIADAEPFIRTNIGGVYALLEAAKRHGVPRFLQISTDEVYGSLGASGSFRESTPLAPNSPYSASKASADLLVRAYHRTHGLPAMITRCSNNYGPRQFPEKLIPKIIMRALNGQSIPIYGDGHNVRDWLYVEDHCEAIRLVLEKGTPGEVYNIGGGQEMTNLELAKTLLSLLGKSERLLEFVPDRLGHDQRYAIDSGKIGRELGWKPAHSFEQGLEQTVAWYAANKRWLGRIAAGVYQTGAGEAEEGDRS